MSQKVESDKNKLKKIENELFRDYFKYQRPMSDIQKLQKEIAEFKKEIASSIFDLYTEIENIKSLINSKFK